MFVWYFCHFLVSLREMGQDSPPCIHLLTDLNPLWWSGMLPSKCFIFHTILESCFVDQDSGVDTIVDHVLTGDSVSWVDYVTVFRADQQTRIGLRTMIDLNCDDFFNWQPVPHDFPHLSNITGLRIEGCKDLGNGCCILWLTRINVVLARRAKAFETGEFIFEVVLDRLWI